MTDLPSGMKSNDPFFERMMDERVAMLRDFLHEIDAKYNVPLKSKDLEDLSEPDIAVEIEAEASNVVPMRRIL